jgi:hypothetical protein
MSYFPCQNRVARKFFEGSSPIIELIICFPDMLPPCTIILVYMRPLPFLGKAKMLHGTNIDNAWSTTFLEHKKPLSTQVSI